MAVATFDTLKFANTLKAAGVPPQQAEAQAVAFAEIIQLNFKELVTKDDLAAATKSTRDDFAIATKAAKDDLTAAVKELRHEMREVEQRLSGRIDTLAAQLRGDMTQLRGDNTLLKWMFGVALTANLGALSVFLRLMYLRAL